MKTRPFLLALLALLPAADFARLLWSTPLPVALAALLPALLLAALALFACGRPGERLHMLAATFFWGALVAAFVSATANDLLAAWIAALTGAAAAPRVTAAIAAPIAEEVAKAAALAAALLLAPRRRAGVAAGMLHGALVGIGFAMTENLHYFLLAAVQAGSTGLAHAVYTRAILGGFNHAVFTATAGAGLGWALERRAGAGIAMGALGLASAQHILWNAFGSARIAAVLCNPAVAGGACREAPSPAGLLIEAPLIQLAFVGPGAILLALIAWRASRASRSHTCGSTVGRGGDAGGKATGMNGD